MRSTCGPRFRPCASPNGSACRWSTATPVRRAAVDTDKVSLKRALAVLEAAYPSTETARRARRVFDEVQAELASTVGLGGRKVLVAAHGKAIESMSAELVERYAEAVIALDEAAAEAIGEPLILPPPAKTPPPPPDPVEKGRWIRTLRAWVRRTDD